jgi:hypothetical protein
MPLAGDLSSFAVDDVITLLMSGRKSGHLSLVRDDDESSLLFEGGTIIDAVHGFTHGPSVLIDILATYSSGHFTFEDSEQVQKPTMHVDEMQLSTMMHEEHSEGETTAPALPNADEKLTVALQPVESLSLTPLEWVLLAEIPRRCTLRHLERDRDPLAVKRALAALLHAGLVVATGQILPSVASGVHLRVVKGYTREEEVVALDQDIVVRWRETGCFTGRVSVAGQVFAAAGRQGLGKNIVISEAACRLCGVRDTQEIDVTPVT